MSKLRIQSLFNMLSTGTESFADGQERRELEYSFYGKLDNVNLLDTASKKEDQEQWNVPLDVDGTTMRIRMIDRQKCILTVKTKVDGVKGKNEVELEITSDMYSALQKICRKGYHKTRYFFPVEGTSLIWEVDVFMDAAGQPSEWIKMELEVPAEDTKVPNFPFELNDSILAQGDKKTDAEKALISRLWDIDWNLRSDNAKIVTPASEPNQQEMQEQQVKESADQNANDANAPQDETPVETGTAPSDQSDTVSFDLK